MQLRQTWGLSYLSSLELDDMCPAGASKGFFDNSVGAQFATRNFELPKRAATNQGAPRKASSGGFFDSSVGAQFAKRFRAPTNASNKPQSYPVSVSDSDLSDTDEDVAEEVDSENASVSAW